MTLEALKEEYKSETINMNNMIGKPESKISQEDLDQMSEEIDEAVNLQEFLDVVDLWSHDAVRIGAAMVVLKKVIDLHDQ